jgi:hypothetical protein
VPEFLKNEMEAELSLTELDNALKGAKISSAGGMDGINNRVLSKFWHLFRTPLHNYTKLITTNGSLTQSFKCASIRLIPKKGDLSKIGNWRPISLLNCIYKVISKAVNNRLQKIAPYILSRAQKGFVKNRFIQECLINVIEKISYCNSNNIPALIVAIDQSKAFDTISHSYMTAVYQFFNIGENFIKLMNGIGNNRTACILWEDGSYSPQFDLKSGRAQGDGPSPLQYNFGEQILLLKIELDPEIRPAFHLAVEAARIPPPLPWFASETNKVTGKVEALADDTTVITECNYNSLLRLKNILTDFGNLSGLECNFEKTCVMPVGGIDNVPFDMTDIGLRLDTKIKLLGMEIDNNLNCLYTAHSKTVEKIVNTVRFWGRFYLSLPGRINIVKTLCLSQITYLGCIIKPSQEDSKTIEETLEKFVKGNLNLSKEKLYSKPELGGVGLIRLDSFLSAQQTLWVKRALDACCDSWREDLYNLTFGNPEILHPGLVNRNHNPILYNVAMSYSDFKTRFTILNDNYRKCSILYNPLITRARQVNTILDLNFFNQNPPLDPDKLSSIRLRDVITNNGPVPVHVLNSEEGLNLPLNMNTYMRLVGACLNFARYKKQFNQNNGSSMTIKDYFKTFKKGSAGIRRIIDQKNTGKPIEESVSAKTFMRITEIPVWEPAQLSLVYGLWNTATLSNRIREFCFKFYHNTLGLNTRISHFVQNHSRACTFCAMSEQNPPDETFQHLFFHCDKVVRIRNYLYEKYFADLGADPVVKKKLWFGLPPIPVHNKRLMVISIMIIQYWIWESKLKKKLPSRECIEKNLLFTLISIDALNKNLFFIDNSFALSRNWENILRNGIH